MNKLVTIDIMNSQLFHILRFTGAIILFIGGIFILVLRIPFWSLVLGIPSIQIGIVFIIFTFDDIGKYTIDKHFEDLKRTVEKEVKKE